MDDFPVCRSKANTLYCSKILSGEFCPILEIPKIAFLVYVDVFQIQSILPGLVLRGSHVLEPAYRLAMLNREFDKLVVTDNFNQRILLIPQTARNKIFTQPVDRIFTKD